MSHHNRRIDSPCQFHRHIQRQSQDLLLPWIYSLWSINHPHLIIPLTPLPLKFHRHNHRQLGTILKIRLPLLRIHPHILRQILAPIPHMIPHRAIKKRVFDR